MKFEMAEMAGSSILSGAPSGRRLYAKLVAALPSEPESPRPLFLDFGEVEVATASYLRESAFEFRSFVRGRRSNFYPVVANAKSDIIDEIAELAHSRNDVIMICETNQDGAVIRHQCIGKLDPMQKLTFDLVNSGSGTTASILAESQTDKIKTTAWNNRLSYLSGLGLIYEQARGRAKYYKPIFQGDQDGRRL